MAETEPLDVWFKFDSDDDEYAEYEANTFPDDGWYRVEWYHTAVGLVSTREFKTYDEARQWLESEGFQDFSTGEDD